MRVLFGFAVGTRFSHRSMIELTYFLYGPVVGRLVVAVYVLLYLGEFARARTLSRCESFLIEENERKASIIYANCSTHTFQCVPPPPRCRSSSEAIFRAILWDLLHIPRERCRTEISFSLVFFFPIVYKQIWSVYAPCLMHAIFWKKMKKIIVLLRLCVCLSKRFNLCLREICL